MPDDAQQTVDAVVATLRLLRAERDDYRRALEAIAGGCNDPVDVAWAALQPLPKGREQ
jgi:hypothetical protein